KLTRCYPKFMGGSLKDLLRKIYKKPRCYSPSWRDKSDLAFRAFISTDRQRGCALATAGGGRAGSKFPICSTSEESGGESLSLSSSLSPSSPSSSATSARPPRSSPFSSPVTRRRTPCCERAESPSVLRTLGSFSPAAFTLLLRTVCIGLYALRAGKTGATVSSAVGPGPD